MYEITEILTDYIKYFDLRTAQYVNFLRQFFLNIPFATAHERSFY